VTPSDAELVDFPRKIVAAAALIFDERGQLLIVKPVYRDGWNMPGGVADANESPAATCHRELLEELALDLEVGRLLALDWRPDRGQGDSLQFIFEGVTLNSTQLSLLRIPEDEISEYRFLPVEQAIATLPERMRPRVAAAVRSLERGVPIYLESGIELGD
jgi:ADP-ribose pyrophosphatase YjhB (NUDIX family)